MISVSSSYLALLHGYYNSPYNIVCLTAYGLATFFSAVCIEGTGSPKVQIQVNKEATNTTTGVENLMQLIVDGNEKDINLIAEVS